MRIIKSILVGVCYLYLIIFIIFVLLLGYLARFLDSPGDILLCFRLPLLGNQIKEIYEKIPSFSTVIACCRRV